jgi:hypothetical protein
MKNQRLPIILALALVFSTTPAVCYAKATAAQRRSRNDRAHRVERTTSYPVEDVIAGEVQFDLLLAAPERRVRRSVPEHREVRVPRGRTVPDRFRVPESRLSTLLAERSIITNVLVLPSGTDPDQVCEPSVAAKGDLIVYTANHFAAFSTDGGQRFTYLSPWRAFRGIPYNFCCDQVIQYVPQIDMFVWSLQALSYQAQVILYATPENVRRGLWKRLLFTPRNLRAAGAQLDYTDMTFGTNMLYWSTNVFGDPEEGDISIVVRIPLAGLRRGNPLPRASKRRWGVRLAQNSGTTGYFAAHVDTSTLRVYSWDEAAEDPTFRDVTVPSWNHTTGWENVGSRVLGATKSGDELWFAWNARARGTDRPFRFARVVRIDAHTFTLIGAPDLWSSEYRIGMPALATNSVTSEVGISYSFGRKLNHAVGILTGTQEHFTTAEGGTTPADVLRWGDYLSIRPHYDNAGTPQPTFGATGYVFDGSWNIRPRYIVFGRGM